MQGIYEIRNKINNKIYIGSSNNIKKRWAHHKTTLRGSYHRNKYLQRAWNKYGESNFEFNLIEEIKDEHNLIIREQLWLDLLKSYDSSIGYNICKNAGSTLGVECSEETKAILRIKCANFGEKNGFYGKHHTIEARKNMSEKKKGKYLGSKHPKSTTTELQAVAIKTLIRDSDLTSKEIAKKVGVSTNVVSQIKNERTWSHIKI